MDFSIIILLLLFAVSAAQSGATASCYCVGSNSVYLTTAATTRHPSSTTLATATTPYGALATTARPTPAVPAALIQLNTSSQLSKAFGGFAFNSSTPGYSSDLSTNQFTVAMGVSEESMLVIDLWIGPTGMSCRRPMPYLDQICISNACAGCNLNRFTASAATTLVGASAFYQKIFPDTSLVVSRTVCVDRDQFIRYGDFQYVVILPTGSPSPSQPYTFKVGMSGNFSAYSCPSRRRRSADDNAIGFKRISSQLRLRVRRSAVNDCPCPVGQNPVFSSVRTVLVSWELPLRHFSSLLSSTNSAEYASLAGESFYLLMNAARNAALSSLASIVADFYDIAFYRALPSAGVKVSGRMTVRNDIFFSDAFLQAELQRLLPGYNETVVNLFVTSSTTESAQQQTATLPGYAIALVCLLVIAALAAILIIVLWRFNLFGRLANRPLNYKVPSPASVDVRQGVGDTGAAMGGKCDNSYVTLESSLVAGIRMPDTAFRDLNCSG